VIDVRGQSPSDESLDDITDAIAEESGGIVTVENIRFLRDP